MTNSATASENRDALLSMRLDGKIALVTGAGRGIGRAAALALSEAGAEIVAWSRIGVNVRAVFIVAQAVAAKMIEQGSGAIVNTSSQMGHVGGPKRAVYCTSKFAVEGFTKALATELAPLGVRVNAVAPTFVETDMTRPMLADPSFKDFILSNIPMGKVAKAADVAAAVVFLASPAAGMITGTSLLVDGGWTAR
jgi:NAD(P)-dependent dehydrogenase (short-subunit alcohol dehydrogenase family)